MSIRRRNTDFLQSLESFMPEETKYTHVGVLKRTHKQISILASSAGMNMYDLLASWAQDAWEKAKKTGQVTDAMLPKDAHWIGEEPRGRTKVSPTVAVDTAVSQ